MSKLLLSTGAGLDLFTAGGTGLFTFSYLYIYSGVRPTVSYYSSNYTTLDSSNLLISFTSTTYTTESIVGDYSRATIGIETTAVAAVLSGEASWFCMSKSGTRTNTGASFAFFLGDVGNLLSTADLKIGSTSIVAGEYYLSSGLTLNIPLEYNF